KVVGDWPRLPSPRLSFAALLITVGLAHPAWGQPPTPPTPSPPPAAPPSVPNPLAPQQLEAATAPAVPQTPRIGSTPSDQRDPPPARRAPPLPPPRPPRAPDSAIELIDTRRGGDAPLKVLVNQARILTLKQDITAGPGRALIAVGDPTIMDFTVVSPRQLRI